MKIFLWLITILTFSVSCKKSIYHVYSPDRSQCFTIKEGHTERYIIPGRVTFVPETNYIKLRIDPVVAENDELVGCWRGSKYELQITINNARVLENKLDTNKYRFSNKLPIDPQLGIPSIKRLIKTNCFHFGFSRFSVIPKGRAIIE